jgi:hypothetical protein
MNPLPRIKTEDFTRFLKTSSHFQGKTILSEFRGIAVRLYNDAKSPLGPSWEEGINPLNILISWKGLRVKTTPVTMVLDGNEMIRLVDSTGYSSTHTITLHEIHEYNTMPKMSVNCTFSISAPIHDLTTGPRDSTYPFYVVKGNDATTTITGFIEFLDISPLVYRQYAKEFDFLHVDITKNMKMCLRVNTGATVLGKRSYVMISRASKCAGSKEMKGYIYHKPPMQMTYDLSLPPIAYKRTTLYFDLHDIPPGLYNIRAFDPDIPIHSDSSVETLPFHSRLYTDIGTFSQHASSKSVHLTVCVYPKSSTEFDIFVNSTKLPVDSKDIIQMKQNGLEIGWFELDENTVIINTLSNKLLPGYYDLELVHRDTKIVFDTVTIFVGVYMGVRDHPLQTGMRTWVSMATDHLFSFTLFTQGSIQEILMSVVVPFQVYRTSQGYAEAFNVAVQRNHGISSMSMIGTSIVATMEMTYDDATDVFHVSANPVLVDGITIDGLLVSPPMVTSEGHMRHYPTSPIWLPFSDSMHASAARKK